MFYLLYAYDVTKIFYALGGGVRQTMTYEDLKRLPILVPPVTEQQSIVSVLDRETVRLDALLATKKRLLELLAEKRRALITNCVTQGVDSQAPLRSSGIPWCKDIPTHWEIWKVGHFAAVGNGSTPSRENSEYWTNGTIPWLNSSVVNQTEVTGADQFITDKAFRDCHLPLVKKGSILVGLTGQGKTRGQAVVLSIEATINQHLAFITPEEARTDSWFIKWIFFAAYEYLRSISDDAGGTKGALTCEELSDFRVPLPPIEEQRAIVAHVATETTQLDAIRVATERTIALLRERREALIAAAVTGQIHLN
jgi:type I restriction enzyme S subunit